MGGINILYLVALMEYQLFSLLLVLILNELSWQLNILQEEEDAMAEVQAEMAYEQWLCLHDYPDHW